MNSLELIKTFDINDSVAKFCSNHSIKRAECNFNLTKVITFYKSYEMETFAPVNEIIAEKFDDKQMLIQDKIIFRELYHIELCSENLRVFNFHFRLMFDKYSINPKLLILPTSIFPTATYTKNAFAKLLYQEIRKIKAKHKILINLFSKQLSEEIKLFVNLLYAHQFNEIFELSLCEAVEPVEGEPSTLRKHYKTNNADQQIAQVEANELIIEYIKPVFSVDGLNCHGYRVSSDDAIDASVLEFETDDATIKKKETPNSVLLYSLKKGYVDFSDGIIKISNKLVLDDIKNYDYKINKDEDNDIELILEKNDETRDTVGEGVSLKSEVVTIQGYVGDNASIVAKEITINGSTHKSSYIEAPKIRVNCHKGFASGKHVSVISLESGEVVAEKVSIERAIGGVIRAKEVYIREMMKNVKVYASHIINVEKIRGEDNKLIINHNEVPAIKDAILSNHNIISNLQYELKDPLKYEEKQKEALQKDIDKCNTAIAALKLGVYQAKITIKEQLKGHNLISFVLPNKKRLEYFTQDGDLLEPFWVELMEGHAQLHPINKLEEVE